MYIVIIIHVKGIFFCLVLSSFIRSKNNEPKFYIFKTSKQHKSLISSAILHSVTQSQICLFMKFDLFYPALIFQRMGPQRALTQAPPNSSYSIKSNKRISKSNV